MGRPPLTCGQQVAGHPARKIQERKWKNSIKTQKNPVRTCRGITFYYKKIHGKVENLTQDLLSVSNDVNSEPSGYLDVSSENFFLFLLYIEPWAASKKAYGAGFRVPSQ